jgi:class 3 adenylate cyclase
VVVESRFAASPSGPVRYRVDGAGPRDVLLVSDPGEPYGQPGAAAFATFVGSLAAQGIRVVTLLDGPAGEAAGGDRRLAALRAVASAAEVHDAAMVGVATGAPVAAVAASGGEPWLARLILHDTFPAGDRGAWQLTAPEGLETPEASQTGSRTPAMSEEDRQDLAALESQLRRAGSSLEAAQRFWDRFRGATAPSPGSAAAVGSDLATTSLSPDTPPFARSLAPWRDLLGAGAGGLAGLIDELTRLEHHGAAPGSLGAIRVPTWVIEPGSETATATLGMEVAAAIPGARHAGVPGTSRWPWGGEVAGVLIDAIGPGRGGGVVALESAPATRPAERVLATVLFTDIVGSTERLTELGDAAWRELLVRHHAIVRGDLARHGGREVDNAGDGFMAVFEAPARGIRCALAVAADVAEIGLSVRCGLHTGECERIGGKIGGIAVHIGARIAGLAGAGEVLVSGTVRDLVAGSGIEFADRGAVELKGLPGTWPVYEVLAETIAGGAPDPAGQEEVGREH